MQNHLRRALGAALLSLSLGASSPAQALPAPPKPVTANAEELAQLQAGQVVVRYGGSSGETVAFVDVAAPPDKVMQAVLDLPPRKKEVSGLKVLEIYRREPGLTGARWEAGMGPYTLSFHVLYEYDLAAGWCVYSLDTSKPNDLNSTAGSYQAYATSPGHSRLVYRAKADASSPLPDWAKKRVAYSSAVEMVGGMKRRAEAAK
jgi:hypothetical protein